MNKRKSLINDIIVLGVTVLSVLAITLIANNTFYADSLFQVVLYFIVGAVAFGLLNTIFHELGHYHAGKKNGFEFVSMRIWFLEFIKEHGKLAVKFYLLFDEAGSTEMLPKYEEDIEKRLIKMSYGGIYSSIIFLIIGIASIFVSKYLGLFWFCFVSASIPVSIYFLLGTLLPVVSEGVRNDGALIKGLKDKDDYSKVLISLMFIQAQIYSGKTPSEIDEKYYFDLPQLPETENIFINLLNARYSYYLDKADYENAKKVSDRLQGLLDSMPKYYKNAVSADLLYNACTFDYDEDTADNLVEDLDKYLNNVNTLTNLRIKLAYAVKILKDDALIERLKEKLDREIEYCAIKGITAYEQKLVNRLFE
ncbi:MAG: hypothetical protein IKA12_05170 [Clostridia bacterium]|nr:hypothetical protein [Clostridia bacterium]